LSTDSDIVEFDADVALALAVEAASIGVAPRPEVKQRLLARLAQPVVPEGFSFRFESEPDWVAHPVPGIRMKVLSINRAGGYATLLLDVAPGTRFPPHYHDGDEECYVVSGSLYTCDRHLCAGDFVHADANTNHGELWTEEGCRVILVTYPEDYMIATAGGR
jgi:quercetin dioxygenase-like cupin family protein